jgi:putative component of membrane protein insertase Oxa1/YidC/SpoIIIJ protein YidD
MAATPTQPLAKGIIATTVEIMVPIINWGDRLGLKHFSSTATSYAIQTYQQHISPRKGFSCAHRRLYGEISCSEYFRQAVLEHGFSQAVPMFQQRLAECRQANLSLCRTEVSMLMASQDAGDNDEQPTKKRSICDRLNCADCGDCSNIGSIPGDCNWNFGSCDRNHNGGCDSNDCGIDLTPDCGGADFGGCDLAGCDVGGCDCSF